MLLVLACADSKMTTIADVVRVRQPLRGLMRARDMDVRVSADL